MATMIVSALGLTFASPFAAAAWQLGSYYVLNRLGAHIQAQELARKRKGLTTEVQTVGETVPQTIPLGLTITSSHYVVPHYSFGDQNKFRVQVVQFSSVPVSEIVGLWVNDQFYTMADLKTVHAERGLSASSGDYAGKFWVRFHDGNQVAADSYLVSKFGGHAKRPWTSDFVGVGNAYAVITFLASDVWQGEPVVRFVVRGVDLFDPRTGTWGPSENLIVIAYNLFVGLDMPDGSRVGVGVSPDRLPLAQWVAAMNYQDAKGFAGGLQMSVKTAEFGGDDPLDVIDACLAAADARVADVAGDWHIQAGPPGLPVATITDAEFDVDGTETVDPVLPVIDQFNAVRVTYSDPSEMWVQREAETVRDAGQVLADGGVLLGELSLPVVQSADHAADLAQAWLRDAARRLRHTVPLTGRHSLLAPLDVVAFSSERSGYLSRLFEVGQIVRDPETLAVTVTLRETDSADWKPDAVSPGSVTSVIRHSAGGNSAGLDGFGVVPAVSSGDAAGRPVIRAQWSAFEVGFSFVEVQVRQFGWSELLADGLGVAESGSKTVSAALVFGAEYEVRARGVSPLTDWTAWQRVVMPPDPNA